MHTNQFFAPTLPEPLAPMATDTAVKIKNANLQFFVLHLNDDNPERIVHELADKLAQTPDFFAATPVALGLAGIAESGSLPDFAELTARLRQLGLHPAGVMGGSYAQRQAAQAAGLGLFPEPSSRPRTITPQATPEPPPEPEPVAAQEPIPSPPSATSLATLVIDKPVRTGQRIHARDANLVVLAVVNAGAELIADGDIHVYAPLRGRALAGARGNAQARIYAQAMEAELVSIAGLFQVFEHGIDDSLRSKPCQVRLEGEQVIMQALPAMR
jgi:septum site-determining protein MinC